MAQPEKTGFSEKPVFRSGSRPARHSCQGVNALYGGCSRSYHNRGVVARGGIPARRRLNGSLDDRRGGIL